MRYEELAAGAINHAVRVTVPDTAPSYVWPARHQASDSNDKSLPPMGLRLRLKKVQYHCTNTSGFQGGETKGYGMA